MLDTYILVDGKPVVEPNLLKWAAWLGNHTRDRIVAKNTLDNKVEVSTVFLGLDSHGWVSGGPPMLWETMIFGGPLDKYQERYTSREAAEEGHKRALLKAKASRRYRED